MQRKTQSRKILKRSKVSLNTCTKEIVKFLIQRGDGPEICAMASDNVSLLEVIETILKTAPVNYDVERKEKYQQTLQWMQIPFVTTQLMLRFQPGTR